MKNVAIINSVCCGSTGKLATGLFSSLLVSSYNSYFCFGYGDTQHNKRFYKINSYFGRFFHILLSRLFGNQGNYSFFATTRLLRFLKNKSIDTIYAFNLHGYYLNERMLFNYIKKNKINLIYVMVDEYPFLGKCTYNWGCDNYLLGCGKCPRKFDYPKSLFFDRSKSIFKRKKDEYRYNAIIFVGPQYTINKFLKSPLTSDKKYKILDESIDTDFFSPCDYSAIAQSYGIDTNRIIVLCVAQMSVPRKGCVFFKEAAKRFQEDKRFLFIHIGYDVSENDIPNNYIAINGIYNQSVLKQFYSIADLFLYPSLEDTMPNACIEALSCGTPLLGFNVSGMPYLTNNDRIGRYVLAKNIDDLCKAINNTCKKDYAISNACREYAVQRYDSKKYHESLITIGESMAH